MKKAGSALTDNRPYVVAKQPGGKPDSKRSDSAENPTFPAHLQLLSRRWANHA
jgi:hypothetical protein